MTCYPDIKTFLTVLRADLRRYGGGLKIDERQEESHVRDRYRVRLYTSKAEYSLSIRAPQDSEHAQDQGYLGCIATCRTARAGEHHLRGNDLADGPLAPNTWHRILADICSYELVEYSDSPSSPVVDAPTASVAPLSGGNWGVGGTPLNAHQPNSVFGGLMAENASKPGLVPAFHPQNLRDCGQDPQAVAQLATIAKRLGVQFKIGGFPFGANVDEVAAE